MFQDLNPLDKTTAILEITIMVVVAFVLGYLVRMIIRKKKEKEMQQEIEKQTKDKEKALKDLQKCKDEKDKIEDDLGKCKEENKKNKKELESVRKELQEQEKLNYEIQYKNENFATQFSSKEEAAEKLGFEIVEESEKEDLTQINGIGLVIQEKLNELGIYTIRQIGKLTKENAKKVGEAIKFFPDRIERDRWIEQAQEIEKNKK